MKTIPLTQGKVALVDDEDFERINQFKWFATLTKSGNWYAQRKFRLDGYSTMRQRTVLMHRFILDLEYGDPREVDHKDREATLDNRRSNLRMTLNQNQQNMGLTKRNVSGFKGVSWNAPTKKWRVGITVENRKIHLGYFPTLVLAAQAYDAAAKEYHGEFAVTNAMLGLLKKPVQSVKSVMQEVA